MALGMSRGGGRENAPFYRAPGRRPGDRGGGGRFFRQGNRRRGRGSKNGRVGSQARLGGEGATRHGGEPGEKTDKQRQGMYMI
jgi:hypothetical protein